MKTILFIGIWSSAFISYNFILLLTSGGSMVVWEDKPWLLLLETIASLYITILLLGILIGQYILKGVRFDIHSLFNPRRHNRINYR